MKSYSLFSDMLEPEARLEQLDEHCYETMRRSYQPSTLKNIRSQALIYNRFCEFYGLKMFPATAWQMVRYARYIANTVTSYDTVMNYLSGVRKLHALGGFEVPAADDPNLRHIMRAIRLELAHPIKQAEPVTPHLLRCIYEHVDLHSPFDLVCYTALLVGFYLFLRKSNLVPESVKEFNPCKQLTRSDILVGRNIMLVVIKWSKTIQYQQKELLLPLLTVQDLRICPHFWLRLMFQKIPAGNNQPLFAVPSKTGGGVDALTYDQLAKKFKLWVHKSGLPCDRYTLHGLRKGGACHALESGLVGEDIKILGDWATDAYMRYLDLTLQRRVDNMVQFIKHL